MVMKRILFAICVVILIPLATNAATITYEKVTTYDNGALLPAARVSTITYKAYYAPQNGPPWTPGASVVDDVTLPAPDPPEGSTWWYTVTAALPGGPESAKAVPASKTVAVPPISAPTGCTVR
jgi:hypothetical protein